MCHKNTLRVRSATRRGIKESAYLEKNLRGRSMFIETPCGGTKTPYGWGADGSKRLAREGMEIKFPMAPPKEDSINTKSARVIRFR